MARILTSPLFHPPVPSFPSKILKKLLDDTTDFLREGIQETIVEGRIKERLFRVLKSPIFSRLWYGLSLLNFHLQAGLNPSSNEALYPDCVLLENCSISFIEGLFLSWGLERDNPLQFHHKGQVMSGHVGYPSGRQFHIRVYARGEGIYGMRAHTEWNGEVHLLRHLTGFQVDFEEGCRCLRKLIKVTASVLEKGRFSRGRWYFEPGEVLPEDRADMG